MPCGSTYTTTDSPGCLGSCGRGSQCQRGSPVAPQARPIGDRKQRPAAAQRCSGCSGSAVEGCCGQGAVATAGAGCWRWAQRRLVSASCSFARISRGGIYRRAASKAHSHRQDAGHRSSKCSRSSRRSRSNASSASPSASNTPSKPGTHGSDTLSTRSSGAANQPGERLGSWYRWHVEGSGARGLVLQTYLCSVDAHRSRCDRMECHILNLSVVAEALPPCSSCCTE